ncbi:CLK4-associating serine/arginine rich protein isoform X1 [Erpetoichthys calabaricus]|uniref:CLK4-associating serine/arginine rich protein isoform X1 n=2 Tax=Erpetoichthys calabaricus TaxID=27687 RepID=UPI0010A05B4B|nr:CLK4-associating serine/arginine rich protein isoform X1 [Erpetoichthys calabaricus]
MMETAPRRSTGRARRGGGGVGMSCGARMWHEARKHERKLRGMMVDYKRRAERRREYYEKIKKDPAQFLQVHGRAYKIHLDPAVAMAAESPVNMMPWQGDANNMIDRFDVRAHLDYIPAYNPPLLTTITPEQEADERKCNYERYRGLVQNDFASISEEQCLYQIYIDELYGGLQKSGEEEKKKLAEKKVSIGYTYEDSTVADVESASEKGEDSDSESSESEDELIPDIDVEVDVDELNQEQILEVNKLATSYGMAEGDFVRMLRKDKEEAEAIKHAKALEEEKAMYSGRRSRRQRREFREKRLKGRQISPPSYARRDSPTYDPYKRSQSESSSESRSRSHSNSPNQEEKITFITSFGGSDDEGGQHTASGRTPSSKNSSAPAPSAATGHSSSSRRRATSSSASSSSSSSSSRSRSRSSSRSRRSHRRNSRRSRSRSRTWRHSRSRSRGRRYSVGGNSRDGRRRSRSRSNDRGRHYSSRRRSRSRTRSRSIDRYRRGGRGGARRRSSSRSGSVSPCRSRSSSPSDRDKERDRARPPAASQNLGDKLRKPENAGGKETGAAKPKLTPQEKLKLRMQKALNKQFKADKKAAHEKLQQQEHERQEREDELRAMARKIRMKERERREKEREEWERQFGRQSRSPSPKYSSREHTASRRRSRSRSRSPHYRY